MIYDNNATQKVLDFVVGKIASNDWKSNDRIWPEHKLCSELGVSRSSVRQAIEKLSVLSIVRKVKGSGTYVMDVDMSAALQPLIPFLQVSDAELLSILQYRKYFETANMRMFMENKNEIHLHLHYLEENYMQMQKEQGDAEKFYSLDFEFHNIIAQGTGNDFVCRINLLLKDILLNHQRRLYDYVGPGVGLYYHKEIIRAIRDQDVELASLLMQRHIEHTLEESKAILKNSPPLTLFH